jgi:uncharacterized FAD-dependent dehydrogenase
MANKAKRNGNGTPPTGYVYGLARKLNGVEKKIDGVAVDVKLIDQKLGGGENGLIGEQKDHEKRIRFLERAIWIGVGGLGILQIVLTFFVRKGGM